MARNAKQNFLSDMRTEMPNPGFLARYLAHFRDLDARAAETLEADLIETFTSDAGLRVLKLFEKSVLNAPMPNGSDDRALREWSAVRNFILEIRRYVSHGTETEKTD